MLTNAIVQRRDIAGGDYYINSGKTNQHGAEVYLNYHLLQHAPAVRNCLFWLSYTYHDFHYTSFKQLTTDYSGNRLPGEAPNTITGGIDLSLVAGWYGSVSYYY